jgi:hypothetical protein
MQRTHKAPHGVRREPLSQADLPVAEIALKFREIAPVGFDGVASEAAFDTKMIEIPLDQPVGFHFGDDSQSFS